MNTTEFTLMPILRNTHMTWTGYPETIYGILVKIGWMTSKMQIGFNHLQAMLGSSTAMCLEQM